MKHLGMVGRNLSNEDVEINDTGQMVTSQSDRQYQQVETTSPPREELPDAASEDELPNG